MNPRAITAKPFIKTVVSLMSSPASCRNNLRLTPITNADSLFLACVKHGCDDQKASGDGTFAYSQNEPNGEQSTKGSTCCMTAKGYRPYENVNAMEVGRVRTTAADIN